MALTPRAIISDCESELAGLRDRITIFQRHASTSREEIIHLREQLVRREQEILNLRQQLSYARRNEVQRERMVV